MASIMKCENDEAIDYVYLGRVIISFSEINEKHISNKRYIKRTKIKIIVVQRNSSQSLSTFMIIVREEIIFLLYLRKRLSMK